MIVLNCHREGDFGYDSGKLYRYSKESREAPGRICSGRHIESWLLYILLSYDIAHDSEITICNKIDKPLVVYRFLGNVMTTIT